MTRQHYRNQGFIPQRAVQPADPPTAEYRIVFDGKPTHSAFCSVCHEDRPHVARASGLHECAVCGTITARQV